jgi:hypothetical protein
MARKWEYHVEKISTEDEPNQRQNESDVQYGRLAEELIWVCLRDLGTEGWELVSFLPAAPRINPFLFYAIFKRPIKE